MLRIFYTIFLHCLLSGSVFGIPDSLGAAPSHTQESFENLKGLQGITTCGQNSLGNVTGIFLTDCNKAPCRITRKKVSLFIEGVMKEDHELLLVDFGIITSGLNIKALPNVNACTFLKGEQSCPLKKGIKYMFSNDFDLRQYYLPRDLEFVFYVDIRDPQSKDKLCAKLPAYFGK